MIAYLKGQLLSLTGQTAVVLVNGVGYEVLCSGGAVGKMQEKETVEVYTYMNVREDGVFLYGFENPAEKNMFLELISVSGIGPKMGIAILSSMRADSLATCIATSDVKSLAAIKGCGKKTAERIILELREKMEKIDVPTTKTPSAVNLTKEEDDAVLALMTLGFKRGECQTAVEYAKQQGATGMQQMISIALRSMSR